MAKKLPKAKKGYEWRPEDGKGRPEKELDYYDCPMSTDIELEDFSKEFLIKMMKIWRNWYFTMIMVFQTGIQEMIGTQKTSEFLCKVWVEVANQMMPQFIPLLGKNYKTVDDLKTVEDSVKLSVLPIDGTIDKTLFGGSIRWENDKLGVSTVNRCALAEAFEAMGNLPALEWLCKVQERIGSEAYFCNPRVSARRIKGGSPRKDPNDPNEPFCIWEYKMEDKPQRTKEWLQEFKKRMEGRELPLPLGRE